MASTSRYAFVGRLNMGAKIGTSRVHEVIRNAVKEGRITYTVRELRDGERLDTLAGSIYGDSRLWWVIAAASEIGWALQVPPGTELVIPDVNEVMSVLR